MDYLKPSLSELPRIRYAKNTKSLAARNVRSRRLGEYGVPPAFLETVVRESLKLPARVWRAVLLEGLLEADFSGELDKIEAPTLIVWGDQDDLTRSGQEALVAAISGSRLVVYPGAGHGVHWEEPELVADDIATFVKEVAG